MCVCVFVYIFKVNLFFLPSKDLSFIWFSSLSREAIVCLLTQERKCQRRKNKLESFWLWFSKA